jgi:hypothetical protein
MRKAGNAVTVAVVVNEAGVVQKVVADCPDGVIVLIGSFEDAREVLVRSTHTEINGSDLECMECEAATHPPLRTLCHWKPARWTFPARAHQRVR